MFSILWRRFKTTMNRSGEPDLAELMAQLATNAAEIAALKAEKKALSGRVVKLEEETGTGAAPVPVSRGALGHEREASLPHL